MFVRRPRVTAMTVLAVVSALTILTVSSGCSSDKGSASPSTTTPIADPITTTTRPATPTTGQGPSDDLPGLWLASPAGITDEEAKVWAAPGAGETLRSPMSDGLGGVIYLRCVGDQSTCAVEDVSTPGVAAKELGQADNLLALGSRNDQRVLLTSWTDPTIVPSFEENRSRLVARLIDLDTSQVTTLTGWFGWESGPFVAAVEKGRFIVCSGEGETCGFAGGDDPNQLAPMDSVAPATVVSLALDNEATRATWVETAPMTGELIVHVLDITTGKVTQIDLAAASAPPSDDWATDGQWVAVRTKTTVALSKLAPSGPAALTGNVGTRTVPDGVTDMAIREPSGGGGPALEL